MPLGQKFGGRVPGSINKTTQEIREIIKKVIENELDGFDEKLSKLKDRDRFEIILKLLPYILPKMESINEDGTTATKIIFSLTKANSPSQISQADDSIEINSHALIDDANTN